MSRLTLLSIALLSGLLLLVFSSESVAQGTAQTFTTYKSLSSFVRVKGQEENFLQGIGLVVGLKGTGDTDLTPTHRALSLVLKHLGNNSGSGPQGEYLAEDLKNVKNVALVMVRAKVGEGGAAEGDFIDCEVTAFGAKSLEGGTLAISTLQGPNPHDKTVWANASGKVELGTSLIPTSGVVKSGCRMEKRISNSFVTEDNRIYLIVKEAHKNWQLVNEIVTEINNESSTGQSSSADSQTARALDQRTIEVNIPAQYHKYPVEYISILMDTTIYDNQPNDKVVINRQKGLIVIGTEVEIGPCIVNHKGINIDTASEVGSNFVEVATRQEFTTQLKDSTQRLDSKT
ncbi:MAG: flagellar basal body P-ring protein FlgI [Pirellulales bacterium]